jgi:flagellar biosynthesis GTPase FlhF
MNEEDDFLKMMNKATAMRGSELKSKFKTMLFTYRNALGMLSGLKNELDEVVNHIDNLDIVTISDFYKPVLEKANDLVNKIEVLDDDIKNHSDMKAYISSIKSHNIDTWVRKLDEVKYQIIKVKENEIRRQREAKEAEERRKQELQRQRNEESKRQAELERQRNEELKRQAELERQQREEIVTFNGLMWEKTHAMNWNDAMEYAKNLQFGGYSDWRLPTVDELKEVVRSCGGTPAEYNDKNSSSIIDKNIANSSYRSCYKNKGFEDNCLYWSCASVSGRTKYAWIVYFGFGDVGNGNKDYDYSLRCVRAGQ